MNIDTKRKCMDTEGRVNGCMGQREREREKKGIHKRKILFRDQAKIGMSGRVM